MFFFMWTRSLIAISFPTKCSMLTMDAQFLMKILWSLDSTGKWHRKPSYYLSYFIFCHIVISCTSWAFSTTIFITRESLESSKKAINRNWRTEWVGNNCSQSSMHLSLLPCGFLQIACFPPVLSRHAYYSSPLRNFGSSIHCCGENYKYKFLMRIG